MKLLTFKDLHALTGVSRFTWRTLARTGRIPVVRLGRRMVRIREEDFKAYVEAHLVPAKAKP